MKITLFRNILGENLASMERYANALEKGLGRMSGIEVDSFTIEQTKFIRPLRAVLRFLPWCRHYANDVFFSRYVLYPHKVRAKFGLSEGSDLVGVSDVCHITDQLNTHLLRVLDPKRTVVTCHDLIPLEYEKDPIALKLFKWNISFLNRAASIIVDSRATKKDVVEKLNISEDKVRVVYLGVSSRFRPVSDRGLLEKFRRKHQLPDGQYLLHVGNGLVYKNREGLLEAFRILSEERTQLSLLILGPKAEVLPPRIKDRVIYLSGLSDQELVLLYNLADVYVQPSFKEGFGWPPLEALACGTSVVSSNIPSLFEVCGPAAVYADPFDPADIARGIDEVLSWSLEKRGRMSEAGMDQAGKFTWEKCLEETVQVYREVAEGCG